MEVKLDKGKGLTGVLSVKINEPDYRDEFEKTIKDYSKKIKLPGFRPGKVPQTVVRKMIEKDAKRDAVEKSLQKSIQDYLESNNLKLIISPVSQYDAEDINWKEADFEFKYDIGLRPEINIDLKELGKLKKYRVSPTDEEVKEEIERIIKSSGKPEKLDTVTDDAELNISLHFHELNAEGTELEGGMHKVKVYTNADLPVKLKELAGGKEKGFKTKVRLSDYLTNDEIRELFNADENTLRDMNPEFEIEVVNIFKVIPPEMNQEFFDRYFEPGKVTSEEEFAAEWKKVMEDYYNRQADNIFATEVKKYLVDNISLDLPDEFLEKYLLMSYEKKSREEIEDYESKKTAFEKELRWIVISETIAEQQKVEINEEDIIRYTMDMINNEFLRGGMNGIDEKTLRQYAVNYLTKENNYNRTSLALRDGKVFDYLISNIKAKEESLSVKKFESIRSEAA